MTAENRDLGEELEARVIELVDALEIAEGRRDDELWPWDAVARDPVMVGDALGEPPVDVRGAVMIPAGTPIEIKSVLVETGNGDRSTPGRFYFRRAQQARLLEEDGAYGLDVYREADGDLSIIAIVFVPATLIERFVSWYTVDSRGVEVKKIGWPHLVDLDDHATRREVAA